MVTEDQKANGYPNLARFGTGFDPRRHVGAPSLGRQITSYMNELGSEDVDGNAKYTKSDLKAIIKDQKSSHPKVVAAQELLRARVEGYDKIDRIPKAADSIDRIMDRTDGKPVQRVEVAQVDARDPEQLRVELMDLIEQFPEVRKGLESLGISRVLPEALVESVDVTGAIDAKTDE